jgi:hypothetical protein
MIGTTGERSARTPGARTSDERAHETDELRPPERQRGLLSFLTWPVLLAQASVAEAAFGDKTASLRPEEEQGEAAARSDVRDPASPDDQLPGALAGSLGRDEPTDALEGPALPGFEEDFARVDGTEAYGGEPAASPARPSAGDPEAQGGGGGGGGGSAMSRSPDPRSASTETHAPGDNAHPVALEAAGALGPTVGFTDAVQPGQALHQVVQPAHALVGETLTGVVDAGLGTIAAVGQSAQPVVTGVTGVAEELVDVALQPVGPVLDVVAPVVDSVAPIVTGVAGVATDVVDVALQPVGPVLDVVAPVVDSVAPIVTGVAGVATDVVDVAVQPIGSTLETVQPVVADLSGAAADAASQPIEPVLSDVQSVVPDLAETTTGIAGLSAEDIATVVESAPIVAEIADAATDSANGPDAVDAGSSVIGTLDGALASGGVIELDGGADLSERASADNGGLTDFDLAVRDLTPANQDTKSTDGGTNDHTSEPAGATQASHDGANDGAGAPSPDEHEMVGTDPLLGGLTQSVDEVALRGDHHLL